MKLLPLALCLGLAGCAPHRPPIETSAAEAAPMPQLAKTELNAKQIAAVKDGVRKSLKDPDSARFGDMIAGIDPKLPRSRVVCGYVNSKNSFGGYTGPQVYYGMLAESGGFIPVGQDPVGGPSEALCSQQGLDVTGLRTS